MSAIEAYISKNNFDFPAYQLQVGRYDQIPVEKVYVEEMVGYYTFAKGVSIAHNVSKYFLSSIVSELIFTTALWISFGCTRSRVEKEWNVMLEAGMAEAECGALNEKISEQRDILLRQKQSIDVLAAKILVRTGLVALSAIIELGIVLGGIFLALSTPAIGGGIAIAGLAMIIAIDLTLFFADEEVFWKKMDLFVTAGIYSSLLLSVEGIGLVIINLALKILLSFVDEPVPDSMIDNSIIKYFSTNSSSEQPSSAT